VWGNVTPAPPTPRAVDAAAAPDAEPGCATDGFDGTTLAAHWQVVAGDLPTYDVSGSRLLVSDAPLAATPSLPGESWINDLDTDKGNQIGWAHAIGAADFTVAAEIGWTSSLSELTMAGIAVSDSQGTIVALAGVNDGWARDHGARHARIRVPGAGDDLDYAAEPVENGSAQLRLERTGGELRVLIDGAEVLAGPATGLVSYVTIYAVPYRDRAGTTYPFGAAEIRHVEVCGP
jgi:hypothetical protein